MDQITLKSALDYNPLTGAFTWLRAARKPYLTGKRADRIGTNGYRYVKLQQRMYNAHRLAWLYMHGPIPHGKEIDHIDRDRANNAISNLRLVTRSINTARKRVPQNRCGYRGVSLHRRSGLYRARIANTHMLGYFATAEEAARAYNKAATIRYGADAQLNTV